MSGGQLFDRQSGFKGDALSPQPHDVALGYRDTVDRVLRKNFEDATIEQREDAARDLILTCALATAGLTLQPIPGLEHAAIPVQVGMVAGLAHVFGDKLSRKNAREVLLDLGATTGVNLLGRQALTTVGKIVFPGIAGVLAAPSMFALTWGTGHTATHYFRAGRQVDRATLKAIFERERRRSKTHYNERAARSARPATADVERGS